MCWSKKSSQKIFLNAPFFSSVAPSSMGKGIFIYQARDCLALVLQSNLYKTTTLGTTQKWPSLSGGRVIKKTYKTTTKQVWWFLADFYLFLSNGNICFNKDLQLHVIRCHSRSKMFLSYF